MTLKSNIPFTRNEVPRLKAENIRKAVRAATTITTENEYSRLAVKDDAEIFHQFLSDPKIHAPIYTLPRPLTVEAVRTFIAEHDAERASGVGLLFLNFNAAEQIGGYIDITIWPHWAAGELGGAVHPDRQGERRGIAGARLSFDWMFEALGLDLICETASMDNTRTAQLLDGLDFRRMGETTSYRNDGTSRSSLVWEVSKVEWNELYKDNYS